MNKIIASGKRKTAIARAIIKQGKGNIKINKKNYQTLYLFDKLRIEEVLKIAEKVLGNNNFDVEISVKGGGEKSQIDASRLALAKAIVKFTDSEKLKQVFSDFDKHLIVADVRRKETYKPNDSKARSKRQSSKR